MPAVMRSFCWVIMRLASLLNSGDTAGRVFGSDWLHMDANSWKPSFDDGCATAAVVATFWRDDARDSIDGLCG